MKRLLSVLLSLLLVFAVFALASCGNTNEESKPVETSEAESSEVVLTDAEIFVGTWKMNVDISEVINSYIADENILNYFSAKDFVMDFVWSFKDDGTYTIDVDKDSATDSIAKFKADFAEGMTKYIEDIIATNEMEMTVEDFLAMFEMSSMEEYVDSFFSEETFDEIFNSAASSGKYEVEDGKLYDAEDGKEIDKASYTEYEIVSENEIKLTKIYPEDQESDEYDLLQEILPAALTRVVD